MEKVILGVEEGHEAAASTLNIKQPLDQKRHPAAMLYNRTVIIGHLRRPHTGTDSVSLSHADVRAHVPQRLPTRRVWRAAIAYHTPFFPFFFFFFSPPIPLMIATAQLDMVGKDRVIIGLVISIRAEL